MSRRRRARRGPSQKRVVPAAPAPATPSAPAAAPGWTERLIPLLVVGAGLYAYHNAYGGPFVLDDRDAIPGNPSIRSFSEALAPPGGTAVAGRPLVNLTLALNYSLSGLHVASYHVFNVVVHLLAALVLLGLVRRTLRSPRLRARYGAEAPWLAMAVALLWVVHPLATEGVTYVIQRTESLMGLFFLLTLYCAARGFEAGGHRGWFAAALGAFGAGLGCKEVIAVAPAVVLVYDRCFWSSSLREALRRHGVLYGAMAAVFAVLTLFVADRLRRAVRTLGVTQGPVGPWDYALTQCGVLVHYLRLAVMAHPLAADYDDWPIARSVADVGPSMLVVLGLLLATLWGLVRNHPLAFLGASFFLILAPTSSFRPLILEVAAERRMYLPLAAVIVLAVIAADAVRRRVPRMGRAALPVLLAGVVVTLAQTTVARNRVYWSTEEFWRDVIAKRPRNARALTNLADHLNDQGRPEEALTLLEMARRVKPTEASVHYGLAITLGKLGREDEAIERYNEALRLFPNYPRAHNNLGNVFLNRGQLTDAERHYREAIAIDTRYMLAHYNLGVVLARQGRSAEAMEYLERALQLDPEFERARRKLAELRGAGAG